MIHFSCEHCGKGYKVSDEFAGKRATCKQCGQAMIVPSAAPAAGESVGPPSPPTSAAPLPPPRADTAAPLPPPPRVAHMQPGRSAEDFGQAMEGADELAFRRKCIIGLGGVLLAAFFLPVFDGGLSFINIEGLFASEFDLQMKIGLLLPLIAGIGAIVAAMQAPIPVRGWVLIGLGALPVVMSMLDPQTAMLRAMPGASSVQLGVMLAVMLLVGVYGLYIGCRVRWYRPTMKPAFVIGVIGGAAMLGFFAFPVEGTPVAAAPFRLLTVGVSEAAVIGLCMILAIICLIAAGGVAMFNTPSLPPTTAHRRARLAFQFYRTGLMIVAITFVVIMFLSLSATRVPFGIVLAALAGLAKMLCWVGGVFLLIPMGVVDVMIGKPQLNPYACVNCGYDMQGSSNLICPECGHANPG